MKRASVAVVAALVLGAAPAPSRAATITGDDAAHWQAVADAAQVPTTPDWFPIRVREAPCPEGDEATGCYMPDEFTLYLNPAAHDALTPRAFYHELGHAWDAADMTPDDRDTYRTIFPETASWPWLDGSTPAAGEWFAESYAWCALDAVNPPDPSQTVYGYAPDRARHQRVCAFIRSRVAAPAATAPASAPQPVVVARRHTTKLQRCRHATMRVKARALRHRKMLRCKRRYGRQH